MAKVGTPPFDGATLAAGRAAITLSTVASGAEQEHAAALRVKQNRCRRTTSFGSGIRHHSGDWTTASDSWQVRTSLCGDLYGGCQRDPAASNDGFPTLPLRCLHYPVVS